MKKVTIIIIAICIIFSLSGCGSGLQKLELKENSGKFEKTEYTVKTGDENNIVMNAPDLLSIEIKGLKLKLDKNQKSKEIVFVNAGIYDIIGNLGNGKLIKSRLTVE